MQALEREAGYMWLLCLEQTAPSPNTRPIAPHRPVRGLDRYETSN